MDDRGDLRRDPAVVLVSNYPYSLEPPGAPGTRAALDSGRLGVIVLHAPRPGERRTRTWSAARLEVTASG